MRVLTFGPLVFFLSSALLGFACAAESTNSGTPAPPSADAAATDGDLPEASVDAGTPSELPEPPATGRFGAVFANSDDTSAGQVHSFGGFFVDRTVADDTVTKSKIGPCRMEVYGNGAGPTESDLSAGPLHFSGGVQALTLNPSGKTYTALEGNTAIFTGGQMITAAADGSDVPAFSAKVIAPPKVTLASPALPATNAALSVDRSTGFSATWTPAASGVVVLYFDAAGPANAYSATCEFAASAGQATIPAAVFTDFPADGTFNFYAKQATVVMPGGVYVRFTASSVVVGPTGNGATGTASFQ